MHVWVWVRIVGVCGSLKAESNRRHCSVLTVCSHLSAQTPELPSSGSSIRNIATFTVCDHVCSLINTNTQTCSSFLCVCYCCFPCVLSHQYKHTSLLLLLVCVLLLLSVCALSSIQTHKRAPPSCVCFIVAFRVCSLINSNTQTCSSFLCVCYCCFPCVLSHQSKHTNLLLLLVCVCVCGIVAFRVCSLINPNTQTCLLRSSTRTP